VHYIRHLFIPFMPSLPPWSVISAALLAIALRFWLPNALSSTFGKSSAMSSSELPINWSRDFGDMDALVLLPSLYMKTIFSGIAVAWYVRHEGVKDTRL
jgi:hypothetical protein